jgi:hypothetical protein
MMDIENFTPSPLKNVKKENVTPIVLALVEMVKKYKGVSKVVVPQIVVVCVIGDSERQHCEGLDWFREEVLDLRGVEDWLREDFKRE